MPEVTDVVCKVLQTERDNARAIVEALIDAEDYLFTNDTDYLMSRSSLIPVNTPLEPPLIHSIALSLCKAEIRCFCSKWSQWCSSSQAC